jgi:hypothetical protein
MTLVDTSVWVDRLRKGDAALKDLLDATCVLTHPFVIGELPLGNLHQRDLILGGLAALPTVVVATEAEVMHFINIDALFGLGLGYVDVNLLASVRLSAGTALWTRDKRLQAVAERLGLHASPSAILERSDVA